MQQRRSIALIAALALYFGLALSSSTGFGVVGEVAANWMASPPEVVVEFDTTKTHTAGPFSAHYTRPLERLNFGAVSLPVAVNTYTGGPPEWPGWIVYTLTDSMAAVRALHVCLGALLLILVHRFLMFHGTPTAAGVASLVLATDWSMHFYRKVLGGTEILLQAAALLVVWSLWSRRWKGGRHGTVAIALGVGLGLLAKLTFVPTVAALFAAALFTRKDHPNRLPPAPPNWLKLFGVIAICLSPLLLTTLHRDALLSGGVHLHSHDDLALQFQRLQHGLTTLLTEGRGGPAREPAATLLLFFGEPLAWFKHAYGGDFGAFPFSPLRGIAWLLLMAGSALAWRSRHHTPHEALLRFLSVAVPLQLVALWLANRDLHHLAQATPLLAIWFGLAINQLAAQSTPARSVKRWRLAALGALPLMAAGAWSVSHTAEQVNAGEAPSITAAGQVQLADLLKRNQVSHLVTSDYDHYGVLETLKITASFTHTWAAISRAGPKRKEALPDVLKQALNGHYLVTKPSAPMIYNLTPKPDDVTATAKSLGLRATLVDTLNFKGNEWAWLYTLRAAKVGADLDSEGVLQ